MAAPARDMACRIYSRNAPIGKYSLA